MMGMIISSHNKKFDMSVQSKTALTTQIDTDLASGSDITAAEHRGVAKNIVDSYEDFIGSYTTAQIAALVGMTLRQRVFNTTDNDYEWYDGTRWVKEAHPKYKVYVALLTQSGTDAPVATVLENNLSGTIVWSRNSTGSYSGTLATEFTVGKTWIAPYSPLTGKSNAMQSIEIEPGGVDEIVISTRDDTFSFADDVLDGNGLAIEIRVYY